MLKIATGVGLFLLAIGLFTGFTEGWALENAAPQLVALGSIYLALSFYLMTQLWDAEGFLEIIGKNKNALLSGGKTKYAGREITKETEVVRYTWVLSFIIFSIRDQSAYYFFPKGYAMGYVFSLITFIFGWWGLPFGLIWTIPAIIKNFKAEDKATVEMLLKYGAPGAQAAANG
ncbi:hypothetical protein HZC34_03865 [Candidatus Saganbacteria bacterium]|nr:hypothetical protein [Candidatus Saganbacteria bacterium]